MTRRARFRLGTLLCTTLLAAAGGRAAHAQPVTGLYVAGAGGVNLLQDEEVRLSPSFPGGKLRFDPGWAGLGSVGYGFGNGVRVELEGNDRGTALQHFLETPFPTIAGGNVQTYGTMANVLFDMDIRQNWIYPYVGIGVGYAWTHWQLHDASTTVPFSEHLGGTDGSFAWQAMFGLSFPVPWVVGLSLTTEYRFMSVLSPENFTGRSVGTEGAFGTGPDTIRRGNVDINSDYNHALLLGLRYEFNPAPPPAPQAAPVTATAPAPAPARTYLVFFDWDRAELTPRARAIVAEAARNSANTQTTTIEVDGYADTSHALPGQRGQAYNLALSRRRADAVRTALVADGVPAGIIEIHAFGDTNLLVATGPNVREPQNRRVEIVLH